MAAGALIVTEKRREFFDFTEPFLSLRSSALIRKPQQQQQQQQQQHQQSSSSRGGNSQTKGRASEHGQQHRARNGESQADEDELHRKSTQSVFSLFLSGSDALI
jgi:hypothetical protein